MSNSNHPYWFYFNLAILGLVAIVVILTMQIRPPASSGLAWADNYWQQKTSYLAGLNKPLGELSGLLEAQLESANVDELGSIRQQLLALRVPSGYQDFHLNVVSKIFQMEELLTGPYSTSRSNQSAVAQLQAELKVLLAEYNNFSK